MQKIIKKRPLAEYFLLSSAVILFALLLVLPLLTVITQGFAKGFSFFWEAISEDDTLSALKLTLLAVSIAVGGVWVYSRSDEYLTATNRNFI